MRKGQNMKAMNQEQLYQEYADCMAVENGDYYNTECFRKILEKSPIFTLIDRLAGYENQILNRAMKELKHRQDWQNLEAEYTCHSAHGVPRHTSAAELLERYKVKIQRCYRAIDRHLLELHKCDVKIAELNQWPGDCKSKRNRLIHWRGQRVIHDNKCEEYTRKANKYEKLLYKWMGICEQLRLAYINKEIELERNGDGNLYGFNSNMQSRETAAEMFTENKD